MRRRKYRRKNGYEHVEPSKSSKGKKSSKAKKSHVLNAKNQDI